MKTLLLTLTSLFLSLSAHATAHYVCTSHNPDHRLVFTMEGNYVSFFQTSLGLTERNVEPDRYLVDGAVEYGFLVGDANDTKTWFVLQLQNDQVINTSEWTSGNDSDNYTARPSDTVVTCNQLTQL